MKANHSTQQMHVFPSELGWMALAFTDQRLTKFTFGHPSALAATGSIEMGGDESLADAARLPGWVKSLVKKLQAYAAGRKEQFSDVPLDLTHLSAFQSRVVQSCRKIGRGSVRTYGELAAAAGSPGAARAVGNVMAQNRFPIIVPCHRVVGCNGALGGFSARQGVKMKERMLALEGANLKAVGA